MEKLYDDPLSSSLSEEKPEYEDAGALNKLGIELCGFGRYKEAEAAFRRAAELNPNGAEAFNNLGNILHDLGRPEEAEAAFRSAISISPFSAEIFNNLGIVLQGLGRPEEAEAAFRRAIELKPGFDAAFNNMGNALHMLGRPEEAEASCRRAITLNPLSAEAAVNLANILKDMGRLDEAKAGYEKALSLNPDFAGCHMALSQIKTFTPDDPQIRVIKSLYNTATKNPDKAYACFALAKAMEDTGNYDEAFALYSEGNALRKKELEYSIEKDRKIFEAAMSAFAGMPNKTPDYSAPAAGRKIPVLIVGMPRSGTSLAEQILASHPDVYGGGELGILERLVQKLYFNSEIMDVADVSRQIASDYASKLDLTGENRKFITDKMPDNFRWLGFVLSALPDIKVVRVSRNPAAVCWSNFKTYFMERGLGFSCDLKDIAEYYLMYENIMNFWNKLFPGRIYELNYEALTENQEEETRKLLEYCGLPWNDACLYFEKAERAVRTASAAQVRKKIYGGSSEAWKNYEKHLGPLLGILGNSRKD